MDGRATGAAALKRLRRRRGLSLADMARALTQYAEDLRHPRLPAVASVQRSVARWESAAPTMPDERYQLLMAHLYARSPSGDLVLGSGTDFVEYLDALGQFGESESHITELRTTLLRAATDAGGGMLALMSPGAQAGLANALVDPSRADDATADTLSSVVADVNAQVGSLPFVRLQLMLAPAVETCRLPPGGPAPRADRSRTAEGRCSRVSAGRPHRLRDTGRCRVSGPVLGGDPRGRALGAAVASGQRVHEPRPRHPVLHSRDRQRQAAGQPGGTDRANRRQRSRAGPRSRSSGRDRSTSRGGAGVSSRSRAELVRHRK